MKELEYKSDEKAYGTVSCPYMLDMIVGSVACWNCPFFKRIDMKNRKVHCMYDVKTRDGNSVSSSSNSARN